MLPVILKEIDREIINLLSKRIAILNDSNLSVQAESGDITKLLAQQGVPEFVWKSITISCAAAIASSCSSTPIKPRKVTVIGGYGKLGRFFSQQLANGGHDVSILEHNDWDKAPQLLGEAQLVLVCVPIEHTLTVIQKAAPYLKADTALADITSVKTPIVQELLKQHTGPVLSLHPMFGPGIQSFLSQNVIVCPGRQEQAFKWLLDLIESNGGKLIACTPEEHDRMMVAIQAIRHFTTFSLGVFLAEEGIDINRSLDFSSPLYRLEIDMVSRLFAQDSALYVDIMLTAEERRQAISRLVETYTRLAQLVENKDGAGLKREFEATAGTFAQGANQAVAESNHIIDSLSLLLAAQVAETQRSNIP
jgi:prephenate dehydrogenase/chorismate mutase/prephenate dehydrogenase